MKTPILFVRDISQLTIDSMFRVDKKPYNKEFFVSMIYTILLNKKKYEYDPYDLLLMVKRLKYMGYNIIGGIITLSMTQVEVDYVTGLSDDEIKVYCTNRFNII